MTGFTKCSPSSRQAPGSCVPSWSLAAVWAPLHWRTASWGQSFAAQKSWTKTCLKNPCQTFQSHLARCLWASAKVDKRTRRRTKVTHRSRSYSSDSLELKRREIWFTSFSLNYIDSEIHYIVSIKQISRWQQATKKTTQTHAAFHHDDHQMEAESFFLSIKAINNIPLPLTDSKDLKTVFNQFSWTVRIFIPHRGAEWYTDTFLLWQTHTSFSIHISKYNVIYNFPEYTFVHRWSLPTVLHVKYSILDIYTYQTSIVRYDLLLHAICQ